MKITKELEYSVYSQNGEDGIVNHIFQKIGTTNRVAVEIGVSVGSCGQKYENNTANLALNGWDTYWFDCNNIDHIPAGCTFTNTLITSKNVGDIFKNLNIPTEFDLLSIDIDGNDYYIREVLSNYKPRVCIMEYNGCIDSTTDYIMPEDEDYVWLYGSRDFGASLKSYTEQANRLGYDLVYCDSQGVNAFYVLKDINPFYVPTVDEAWIKLRWA